MWNKIKTVFSYIGAFFVGIVTAVLGAVLYNHRKSASGVGTDSKGPAGTIAEAERTIRESREARRKLDETTRRLEETNGRFGEILSEVRKNKQDTEDSNSGV